MKPLRYIALFLGLALLAASGWFLYSKYVRFSPQNLINPAGQTLATRIKTPEGFYRDSTATGFTAFARQLKVLPHKTKLKRYDGAEWFAQNWHAAILDFDTGKKNLQQCADCCLRLHAEYLWQDDMWNKLDYEFTSGDKLSWPDYASGTRVKERGNGVEYVLSGKADKSYENFRRYLDCVYTYAGTISVNRQFRHLRNGEEPQPGDVIVKPGSPGHAVMLVDVCQNASGKKLYLISQGYTPAVQIHIVNNTSDRSISPWFEVNGTPITIKGAGFGFTNANIVRMLE